DMTPEELRQVRGLIGELARVQPMRRSRRLRPARPPGVLDARRTLRAAMRTQGGPVERAGRRPERGARKPVFLCGVAGPVGPYAGGLVMFMQALTSSGRRVEAFAFGTRLTRLTPYLAGRDPAAALARAGAVMPDWGGGTRVGESLAAYNRNYGRRALTRGA